MFMNDTGYYNATEIKCSGLPDGNMRVPVTSRKEVAIGTPFPRRNTVFVQNGKAIFTDAVEMLAFFGDDIPVIYRTVFENADWPNEAMFKLEYELSSWPMPMETNVKYFSTDNEMRQYITDQQHWAEDADNNFRVVSIWEWDLGPNLIK